ncbi:MAG: ABC transporter permease [Alphaproteobacteria bacterium]|nr:ABC transporter permease [Alphaproteobacteria bacterium]
MSQPLVDSLWRILALVQKELLAVLKDRKSRFSLMVPPILQILIFGYAATYDLNYVPYAVLDQDRGAASRELLAQFDGTGIFQRVANLDNASEIGKTIDDQTALVVIQIGQDFSRNLALGRPADVQLIADGRNSNTAAIASGYVATIVDAFNAQWPANHGQTGPPVATAMRAWFNPELETRWHMIPSIIGTIVMMMTMNLSAMSVARERENGTFDQLLVTPFRPAEIMIGKAVPAMFLGLTQSTMILLVAQLWFRIPFQGSVLTLYAGLALFLIAAVGVGLFVSSIAATMQQAMIYIFVVIMPFALLSGLTTPIDNMPLAFQYLTLINPLRYAIIIAQRVYLEGAGIGLLIPDLWPMAIIAAVTLSAATWMFRHKVA